ncbi:hypothetical protein Hanom_Chr08g00753121 [Helianthus anomalus]
MTCKKSKPRKSKKKNFTFDSRLTHSKQSCKITLNYVTQTPPDRPRITAHQTPSYIKSTQ